jgi:hypothetical protein
MENLSETIIKQIIIKQIISDMIYILEIYEDITQTMIKCNYEIDGKYNKNDLHLFYTFCGIGRHIFDYNRSYGGFFIDDFINTFLEYYNRKYDDNFCIDFFYGIRQINKKSIYIPTPTTVNKDIEKIKSNIKGNLHFLKSLI